jgi:hypothetical protein
MHHGYIRAVFEGFERPPQADSLVLAQQVEAGEQQLDSREQQDDPRPIERSRKFSSVRRKYSRTGPRIYNFPQSVCVIERGFCFTNVIWLQPVSSSTSLRQL